ncbi:related to MFS multidrug transporter [Phialocephala subalpina]|uniref:Related to MFS multidrug transporter n=1 Tax=Phialocephala subalpina TaxID=576137 RepID=A0A1L7WIP9_9HELO|nr:related to MFS multidrug transporter [Phialocephala subalpina]
MSEQEKGQEAVPAEPPVPYSIFTSRQKAVIVATVAVAATFSGFASNIYFPAIPTIALDLGVTPELINLTVTSYMIFQGLAPTIWGAVADVHGRRVTYICTFVVLIGACIGLAETRHYYQLVILRCLQSAGSASTIAIGAGVIGDITIREERGGYMGIYQAGLLAPVAVGPILGGIFSQTLGWHAIFWFLAIYAAVFLMFLVIVLPETLRSMVGNGSLPAKGLSNSLLGYMQRRKLPPVDPETLNRTTTSTSIRKALPVDFLGPVKIIFTIECSFAIFFLAIYYTVWQMAISILSTLFKATYGLTELQIGLTFIGNGAGCIIGTLTTGKFLDFDYRRVKRSFNGNPEDFPLEKARLRTLWLWSGLQLASVIVFGWTMEYGVHISVPIICTFVLGWAATSIISVVNTFLVDIFPKKSASATASLNLVRCLMGAGGTAAVLPVVNAIGIGWTFTLLAGIMVLTLGLVWCQMKWGAKWRKKRQEKETAALNSI